ncbi:RNA methyltransferase [Pseudoflavonifractor sp. 60]|uniref:TrmH family RNA methyltransferase n=1 Tax=Pseudoflavonifractor sp. 60 TaxID=2304576 RepID=UPI00136A2583|nr:RNA methyltransferase [Pseudoflavonifractor sp. 60]
MEQITSRKNPICTHFRKLASSRAYREETGEMLCDSPKLLEEASLWGGHRIHTVLYTQGVKLPVYDDCTAREIQVTESVMESVSPMKTPQGVVFSCAAPTLRLPGELKRESERYLTWRQCLVLDGVQDPGNVGTILRTADAFNCGPVFLLPGCADANSPKAVRAAMGVHFRQVIYQCTLEELTDLLGKAGIPLYAAALGENTADVREADLSSAAVVIGSEGRGVSREVLAACAGTLKIPMSRRCESLNAAVAAAVILWEMGRGKL